MSVTPEDIELGYGRAAASEVERDRWSMWISDALMLIEARLGDPSALDQNRLNYVIRESVIAHLRHPDDATQVSVSVDDATSSRTYRTSRGRIHIPDEFWELLSPAVKSGAFSVDTLWAGTWHLPWCSINFGATFCSCGVDIAGEPIFEVG